MKHLKNSLIVFAGLLVLGGVVTFFVPSLTKGMASNSTKQTDGAFSFFVLDGEGPIRQDPAGTSYAITSLTISNTRETYIVTGVHGNFGDTDDCKSFFGQPPEGQAGPIILVPAGQTVHLSFPQPFVISPKPGRTSCLVTGAAATYTVVGYKF
jgi:hypothetical protein